MKNYIALSFLGTLFFLFSYHEISAQEEASADGVSQSSPPKLFYFAIDGQIAIPLTSLKEYSKTRGGIRFEFGKPFKAHPSMSIGIELSGIFSGSKNDKFKGLEVNTSTMLLELQPFIRWVPKNNYAVNPFLDFSIGIAASNTETTSEIVDEPTFLEQVLFGTETEVETTTHQSGGSTNFSYSVGAGVIIKKFIMVGIRYHHANPVDYIDTDKVNVEGGAIQYKVNRIPLDMIVVTIGIGIWKLPQK